MTTTDKRITTFFLLILSWAIYDKFGVPDWSTNWVVFFFTSFYGFALYWLFETWNLAKGWLYKAVLLAIFFAISARLLPQLLSIGKSRGEYNQLVSNQVTDFVTWLILLLMLISVLWAKYIRSSRR